MWWVKEWAALYPISVVFLPLLFSPQYAPIAIKPSSEEPFDSYAALWPIITALSIDVELPYVSPIAYEPITTLFFPHTDLLDL